MTLAETITTAAAVTSAVVAIVAVIITVRATSAARTSAKAASRSADAAVHANELAEQSEARAARAEARSTESRDVSWTQRWIEDAETLSFENVGLDTAHDVRLVIDTEGMPRQEQRQPRLHPHERIGIRLSVMVTDARADFFAQPHSSGLEFVLTVDARLTWTSGLGVADTQTWKNLHLVV